jgi:5-methylcytosine-specific restriction protein A
MADAEDAQAAKLNESAPRRILFARIGSMTYYAGRQKGDEKPKGGGRYNQKNVGHEVFNFANSEGWLYGFARAKAGSISLGRIDPASGQLAKLDNVLVIFVARQRIVGWYDGALVHRIAKAYPKMVSAEMRKNLDLSGTKNYKIHGYQFEVPVEKATLIPTRDRVFEVPAHVKGGFGQSNVCYQYRTNGKVKAGTWMKKALSYVLSYDKANLLTDPTAEKESDEDATIAQEQAAGFQSNPVIRRKVELYAMGKARTQLEGNEYENIQNTSKFKPYPR